MSASRLRLKPAATGCSMVVHRSNYAGYRYCFLAGITKRVYNWDDNFYVTDDPLVTSNTVPVKSIFETPVCLNYHPLTVLTLH